MKEKRKNLRFPPWMHGVAFACLCALALSSPPAPAADGDGLSKSNSKLPPQSQGPVRNEPRRSPRGPLEEEAERRRAASEAEIRRREAEAAEQVKRSSTGACTGGTCTAASDTSSEAARAANSLASSAASRQPDAEEARKDIVAKLRKCVDAKKCSSADVARAAETFRKDPFPSNRTIESFPQAMHDPMFALRTANEEARMLDRTAREYGVAGVNAQQMTSKVAGHNARANSLVSSASATASALRSGSARLAAKASSSHAAEKVSGKGGQGDKAVSASGGFKSSPASGSFGSEEVASPSESKEGRRAPESDSGWSSVFEAKSEDSGNGLGGESTDLLAGMMAELRQDIAEDPPTDLASLVAARKGKNSEAITFMGERLEESSVIGGAILAFKGNPLRENGIPVAPETARGPSSQLLQANIDLLDMNKSLFTRIHEQLRRRAKQDLSAN